MYLKSENIIYLKYDFVRNLDVISFKKINAKLDLKTMQEIQRDINTRREEPITIPKILELVAELDCDVISTILIKSIQNIQDISATEIMEIFTLDKALMFTIDLLKNSMPGKEKKASMFEDDDEDEDKVQDWDFDYMFHLWTNVLKRADNPWSLTPKSYFKQLKLFEEMQNKQNNEQVEEV